MKPEWSQPATRLDAESTKVNTSGGHTGPQILRIDVSIRQGRSSSSGFYSLQEAGSCCGKRSCPDARSPLTCFSVRPGHGNAVFSVLPGMCVWFISESVILALSVPQTQVDLIVPSGKCFHRLMYYYLFPCFHVTFWDRSSRISQEIPDLGEEGRCVQVRAVRPV